MSCDAHAPPGSWLGFWQERLPVRSIMIGDKKGRSISGLRNRVQELKKRPDTRAQGLVLEEYLVACESALSLRGGGAIPSMAIEDLRTHVKNLQPHINIFPADCAAALLYHRKQALFAEQRFQELAQSLLPWHGSPDVDAFDPQNPCMGLIPRPMHRDSFASRECCSTRAYT